MKSFEVPPKPAQTDGRGALRHITPDLVKQACALVRTGKVISLNLPLDQPVPPPGGRPVLKRWPRQHNQVRPSHGGGFSVVNDDVVEFALQGSSQWDGLAHFGIIEPGSSEVFYGGRGLEEVYPAPVAKTLGVEHLAEGIVTRGVLLDLVAQQLAEKVGYLPDTFAATADHVKDCLVRQRVSLQPGDAVFVFTGFERRLAMRTDKTVLPDNIPGIDGSTLPIWRDTQVSALVSDNISVEVARRKQGSSVAQNWASPVDHSIHRFALRHMGIILGELWALENLAQYCRAAARYEFLLVSAPLNIPGAFGSPANALAIF